MAGITTLITKSENMKWWWECGATGTHTFLMGMQNWIATLENGLIVSFKVKHMFIMQIKSLIPGIYPKETKACVEKKKNPSMQVCIAVWHIIASNQKQPNCPLTGACINKLWHIHTMEYSLSQHQRQWITDTCNYIMSTKCIIIGVRS